MARSSSGRVRGRCKRTEAAARHLGSFVQLQWARLRNLREIGHVQKKGEEFNRNPIMMARSRLGWVRCGRKRAESAARHLGRFVQLQ